MFKIQPNILKIWTKFCLKGPKRLGCSDDDFEMLLIYQLETRNPNICQIPKLPVTAGK